MSRHPLQVVIFGPQGSGKGTQAELLATQLQLQLIGMGDILRRMIADDTEIGQQIAPTVHAGQLIPDDLSSEIIAEQIEPLRADQGFLIEGYPRTVVQANQFKANLERLGRSSAATTFIVLEVPRSVLVDRLLKRQRHDDTEALIEERLGLYEAQTKPVLDAVAEWAEIVPVNGDQPVAAVTEAIATELSHVEA